MQCSYVRCCHWLGTTINTSPLSSYTLNQHLPSTRLVWPIVYEPSVQPSSNHFVFNQCVIHGWLEAKMEIWLIRCGHTHWQTCYSLHQKSFLAAHAKHEDTVITQVWCGVWPCCYPLPLKMADSLVFQNFIQEKATPYRLCDYADDVSGIVSSVTE